MFSIPCIGNPWRMSLCTKQKETNFASFLYYKIQNRGIAMAKNKKHIFDIEKLNIEKMEKELAMPYDAYVKHLLEKYGHATCDYFRTSTCKSKNSKTSRTEEGLYCHHIDEDKAIMLSTPEVARLHPFEYQKADRLVYCNILEHLLLHIKIAEEREDITSEVGIGGTVLITEEINMHITKGYSNNWKKNTICTTYNNQGLCNTELVAREIVCPNCKKKES